MTVELDTLFLQLTREEALMVTAGLVLLGMDSGLLWELGVSQQDVEELATKVRDCAAVQEFL